MAEHPGFDPYQLLGVDRDADEIVIQLAYRVRIRSAHPDVAGPAGLDAAKRLNVARDWLLDPERRAQLDWGPAPAPAEPRPRRRGSRVRSADGRHRSFGARRHPRDLDPETADFGPRTDALRAFLHAIRTLTVDERARVNYSLGEAPPAELERYDDYLPPGLWSRSRALRDAVERAWDAGLDEASPEVPRLGRALPTGFLVANAHAQWILLEDFFRDALEGLVIRSEPVVDGLAGRCLGPWRASVGQPRYGPREHDVLAFFDVATQLQPDAAERLSLSWRQHMGRDGRGHPSEHIGPGVWLPTPPNYPDVLKVSGFVAAVDATRITPPGRLRDKHVAGFTFGLRLTAHVLAMGLDDPARDYLRPWRDAVGRGAATWGELSWRAPTG